MTHDFRLRKGQRNGEEAWSIYERTQVEGAQWNRVGLVWGWRLPLVKPILDQTIARVHAQSTLTYRIPEDRGVKIALILRALQRIHLFERAERLLRNIWNLSREESYFWYSKVFDKKDGNAGLRALRILYG